MSNKILVTAINLAVLFTYTKIFIKEVKFIMKTLFKINGVTMPTPKNFKVTINDIDSENTTRDARGTMHRDRIAVKRKLEIEYPPIFDTELKPLLNALSNVTMSVTFRDITGDILTKTMYVGDRSGSLYSNADEIDFWENFKFDLIEC